MIEKNENAEQPTSPGQEAPVLQFRHRLVTSPPSPPDSEIVGSPQSLPISEVVRMLDRQMLARQKPHEIRANSVFKLKPGLAWNPLLKLPRNSPCPCRSGRKFKKCCAPSLPPIVPEGQAAEHLEAMSKPDLIFITADNQELVKRLAEERANAAADPGTPSDQGTPV